MVYAATQKGRRIMATDEAQPWEQMPGESAIQWAAFRAYRDLPPEERSIRAAWAALRAERGKADAGKPAHPPAHWHKWSAKNAWSARAAAYDREQDRLATAQALRDRVAAKKRRLAEAGWIHVNGADRLREMAEAGESIPAAVALRMVEVGQNAERLEMGEATERTEAEVSAVAPEEAASREAQVQALLRLMFPLAEEGEKIETGAPVGEGG